MELHVPIPPFSHGEYLNGDVLTLMDVQQAGRHGKPDRTRHRWKRQAFRAINVERIVENPRVWNRAAEALLKERSVVLRSKEHLFGSKVSLSNRFLQFRSDWPVLRFLCEMVDDCVSKAAAATGGIPINTLVLVADIDHHKIR